MYLCNLKDNFVRNFLKYFWLHLKISNNFVSDFDFYYTMIRSTKKEYIDTGNAAKEFLSTNIKEKFRMFQKYIAAANDARTMLSERTQDPSWFEGRRECTFHNSFKFYGSKS